jgi:hypothetical protein
MLNNSKTTTANSQDFGDLTLNRRSVAATSNGTNNRGVFGGGGWNSVNVIDYITITSLGNAIDFGDMSVTRTYGGACSNS